MHKSLIFDKLITSEEETLRLINNRDRLLNNCLITYFNQHCYNIYSSNKVYQLLIDKNFKTYIDGIGIFLVMKIFRYPMGSRFNATDLNEKFLQYFIERNYKVYIVGGKFSKDLLTSSNRKLNLIGYRDGFFTDSEEEELLLDICAKDPDVIIVGMGVPKQEFFSIRLSNRLKGKSIICVGNFLEFYLGTIKRIPKSFRNIGVEWIFRMISEPGRLWKRYIIGTPLFFFLVMKEYFSNK